MSDMSRLLQTSRRSRRVEAISCSALVRGQVRLFIVLTGTGLIFLGLGLLHGFRWHNSVLCQRVLLRERYLYDFDHICLSSSTGVRPAQFTCGSALSFSVSSSGFPFCRLT